MHYSRLTILRSCRVDLLRAKAALSPRKPKGWGRPDAPLNALFAGTAGLAVFEAWDLAPAANQPYPCPKCGTAKVVSQNGQTKDE